MNKTQWYFIAESIALPVIFASAGYSFRHGGTSYVILFGGLLLVGFGMMTHRDQKFFTPKKKEQIGIEKVVLDRKGEGNVIGFLYTYGWVILVVLAVIGAFAYFHLIQTPHLFGAGARP